MITVDNLILAPSASLTFTLRDEETLVVTTSIHASTGIYGGTFLFNAATGATLTYNGTIDNCRILGLYMTNLNAGASSVPIYVHFGTVTSCTGIKNIVNSDISNRIGILP